MKKYLFILPFCLVNIFYCQGIDAEFGIDLDSTKNIFEINIPFGDTTKIDTSSIITIYYNDGSRSIHSQLRMEFSWGIQIFRFDAILIADENILINASDIDRIIGKDGEITLGEKLRKSATIFTAVPYIIVGIIFSLSLII